jgi:two-component system, cell cycle sensor histidine kinase and response regulator CckA
LLTFAKGGAPVKEVVEVAALLREVLDLALDGSPVRPELELRATLAVQADPGQIRELDSDLRVVVSSGYSDDPAIARFSDYGFIASVKKPYTLDALRETLESCCVRRPTQK